MKLTVLWRIFPALVSDKTYNLWVSEALFKGTGPLAFKRQAFMRDLIRQNRRVNFSSGKKVDHSDLDYVILGLEAAACAWLIIG